jgi:small subunit ribosomal protein S1
MVNTSKNSDLEKALAQLDEADKEVFGDSKSGGEGSFEQMFEASMKENQLIPGEVVTGTVVEVQTDYVLVDINYKSEGLIPISEFRIIEGQRSINVGDKVDVMIDKIENDNGMIVLSKDKADMMNAWNDISRAAENEEVIEGTVISKVKGGLSVDIGVKAFLPGSQIDLRPVKNIDSFIGRKFKFKVIKFNKKRGNIVLSRRAILEEEREKLKTQTLDEMNEGAVVKGFVKNVTDYGAFIDLGGLDGLLHITDMSWGRIKHPNEMINVGEELELKVLKYDQEKQRVSLGLKQLTQDPWGEVAAKFPVGMKIKGNVVSLADYGAFIDLTDGVEGLIHVNEMSWTKKVKHPSQLVNVGDEVEVQVLSIDSENRRISLGMKQLESNPWMELKETYAPGTIIEGEVKSITDFGIFVGIEDGIDGLVHISDFSWTKRINHPSEMYKKGDSVKAVVLGVDIDNERFSLGLKQLESDPWSTIEEKFPIGSQLEVEVTKLADFGIFVKVENDIEGLIHISELSTKRVEKTEDVAAVGDKLKAEIISIDQDARKIGLSAKLVSLREQKVNVDDYVKKATATSKTSLGEAFGDAFREIKKDNQVVPNEE